MNAQQVKPKIAGDFLWATAQEARRIVDSFIAEPERKRALRTVFQCKRIARRLGIDSRRLA